MIEDYEVIRKPLITEKNMHMAETKREYAFEVDVRANKVQIRQAVERIFGVKVERVNTSRLKGATHRVGWNLTTESEMKKAVVKLAEGEKIDLL